MVDRDTFDRLVREALASFRERSLLLNHPLVDLLGAGPCDGEESARLTRVLLEAIQELRPPRSVPRGSPSWRSYRCMFLRYVEGDGLDAIADELGVGERQIRRDHQEGIRRLCDSLWARHCRLHSRETASQEDALEADAASRDEVLEAQLMRVGAAQNAAPTDLGETVEGALATVARFAQDSQVALVASVPRGLCRVVANRVALRQVLVNLLCLAIDLASGRRVCIAAQSRPADGRVDLTLTLPLRKPPQSVEDDTRFRVSRRLVEILGGTVDVRCQQESGEDDGCCALIFEVGLRVADLDAVLLIDDDPDVYRLFQRYLKASPYRLVHSLTSQRAIELAQKARPHAIILDVIMPARDGWEILQELRDHRATRDIPVIVCSVLEERGLAESLGATEFVLKPVTRQGLLSALDRCRLKASSAERRGSTSDTRSPRERGARPAG